MFKGKKLSKAQSILGTVGLIGGAWYANNKGKKLGKVAVYGALLGLGGILLGGAITKFYE